jgi:ribonuclease HI
MTWSRMRFKGEPVWVRVDAAGKTVLDSAGRAEMKYRQEDPRSYRPSAGNLTPAEAGDPLDDPPPRRKAKAPDSGPDRPVPAAASSVNVWTDGACSGNPGPMGIGVVVLADGKRLEHGEYLGLGTNNIAELVAIERGLQMATDGGLDAGRPIRVHTDSGYSIGVLSKGWKAKANQDLIARLRRMLSALPQVHLVKVAGHAGVPENERCDELARDAITSRR